MKKVWDVTVVGWVPFCISGCLIREARISNEMPSTQSHIFSLLVPALCSFPGPQNHARPSLGIVFWGTGLHWETVILIDSVLSRDGHLAGVT